MSSDSHHDFVLMSWAITNMYNDFYSKYKTYIDSDDTYIAQEAPISAGINSGKLNALGYMYYYSLGYSKAFNNIKTYHPIKLKAFHHKKSYNKKDTIAVVEDIINMMEEDGYEAKVIVSRTKKTLSLTDGECDAFMYAIKTYIDNRPDSKLTKKILEKYPRFSVIISIEEQNKYI